MRHSNINLRLITNVARFWWRNRRYTNKNIRNIRKLHRSQSQLRSNQAASILMFILLRQISIVMGIWWRVSPDEWQTKLVDESCVDDLWDLESLVELGFDLEEKNLNLKVNLVKAVTPFPTILKKSGPKVHFCKKIKFFYDFELFLWHQCRIRTKATSIRI